MCAAILKWLEYCPTFVIFLVIVLACERVCWFITHHFSIPTILTIHIFILACQHWQGDSGFSWFRWNEILRLMMLYFWYVGLTSAQLLATQDTALPARQPRLYFSGWAQSEWQNVSKCIVTLLWSLFLTTSYLLERLGRLCSESILMHSLATLPGFNLDTTSGGADMSLTITSNSQFAKFSAAFAGIAESWAPRNCNYYKGQDLSSNYVIKPASEGKNFELTWLSQLKMLWRCPTTLQVWLLQLWQLCCRSG